MWGPPSSERSAAARVERTLLSCREPGRARLWSYRRAIRVDRDAGFRPSQRDRLYRQYFLNQRTHSLSSDL
jgi:hypothetical protein